MVYMDDNTKEKIQKIKLDTIYFLANFDNVITDNNSSDTWTAAITNAKAKKAYLKKVEELKLEYRSIELNNNINFNEKCDYIKDICNENINLYKELKIDENKIKRCIGGKGNIKIRNGVKTFLKFAYEKNIPVIIISDGVSEIIKCFLKYNNCYYNNIHIISNCIFDDNEANRMIHPLTKNELSIPDEVKNSIKDRKVTILLASSINDINMLSKSKVKDSIKVAFLDKNINENFDIFLNYFNVICTHNSSFDLIVNKLKKK